MSNGDLYTRGRKTVALRKRPDQFVVRALPDALRAMTRPVTCRRSMWLIPLLALASLPSVTLAPVPTAARDPTATRCQLVPDTWTPSLDQVREYLEAKANAETNPSQRVLTETSQNLADLCDAQLFITYIRLMQTLDGKGQSELLDEQTRWLDRRAARARAAVTSTGGSLEPLEYSGAFAKVTEERIAELRERLQRQSTITRQGEESRQ